MAVMNIREAINLALHEEMPRDSSIIVLGKDVVGGAGTAGGQEAIGGIWGTTGLFDKFGTERVIDTPISESAIIGATAGTALAGMRPRPAELMFADFIGVSLDQLWNQMAKFRYMFGGRPMPGGRPADLWRGMNSAAQHSQSVYALLTSTPGQGRAADHPGRCQGAADRSAARRRPGDVL